MIIPFCTEAYRIRKQLAAAGVSTAPATDNKLGDGGKPLGAPALGYKSPSGHKPSPFDVHHEASQMMTLLANSAVCAVPLLHCSNGGAALQRTTRHTLSGAPGPMDHNSCPANVQVHHLPAVAEADVEDGSPDVLAQAASGLSSLRSRAVSVRASGAMSVVNR